MPVCVCAAHRLEIRTYGSESNAGHSSSAADCVPKNRAVLSGGVTPLHAAAAYGHNDVVAMLLLERKGRGTAADMGL